MNIAAPVVEHDMDACIKELNPHFSSPFKKRPQTVFLAEGCETVESTFGPPIVKMSSVEYIDSDRLKAWVPNYKRTMAMLCAQTKVREKRSARFIQELLRALSEDPDLQLIHVLSGADADHYIYHIYGFIPGTERT